MDLKGQWLVVSGLWLEPVLQFLPTSGELGNLVTSLALNYRNPASH
jgi:hypothetical protein